MKPTYLMVVALLVLGASARADPSILPLEPSRRLRAEGEAWLPTYSLKDGKPTNERILSFLKGGVAWRDFSEIQLTSDGKAKPIGGGYSDHGSLLCVCQPPNSFVVAKSRIEFACQYHCTAHQSGNVDPNLYPPKEISNSWTRFSLRPMFVSDEAMMYQDQDKNRWLVTDCSPVSDEPGIRRRCQFHSLGNPDYLFLIELIQAAESPSLLEAARNRLQQTPAGNVRASGILVHGNVARRPRTGSQVFYVVNKGASEEKVCKAAKEVAVLLAPVVGEVEVEKWPGEWDSDVVVVVGAAKRTSSSPR